MLYDYLTTNYSCVQANTIIAYNDGCSYQNRCTVLCNTQLLFTKMNNKILIHKYLCKGHTQMEVDSIHSVIERTLKNRSIYSPASYIDLIEYAKKKDPKYEVLCLDHTFFRDFRPFNFYNSIRPGRTAGDHCVTDICQLRYTDDISYELAHTADDWVILPQRKNKEVDITNIPGRIYAIQRPIKHSKWDDLQSLKLVIPKDYHPYYNSLEYI